MRVFKHRSDPEYLSVLRKHLDVSGPNGVEARSIKISNPLTHEGRLFERCCRIDFAGIAATTLFDTSGEFCSSGVAESMRALIENAASLNDKGIFIKIRILLVYPYSDYAFSRIQAESTRNRSSMDEPIYARSLNMVEAVDQRTFLSSHLVRSQTTALNQLQEWVDNYGWSRTTANKFMVRFMPTSPNFCLLFVNDTVFADSYLLAKRRRSQTRCELLAPLVEVGCGDDPETFAAIDDHFRYLWDLDLTLYCGDATRYEPGVPGTLSRVKPTDAIVFDSKGEAISEKVPDLSDEDVGKWKFRVRKVLRKFCTLPAPTPGNETVFITCSWETQAGQATPNRYAKELSSSLERDFGRRRDVSLLSVFVMEGVAGEFFSQQLYARLEESTLGLVLLTADIAGKDEKFYSRPNVYHELGYLMKHLGPDRVAIVCENGVTVPSNIGDVIRIDFEKDKLILAYNKIAKWVLRSCSFGPKIREEVESKYAKALEAEMMESRISADEVKRAKDRMESP